MVRLDGKTYKWMGDPRTPDITEAVTQKSLEYTSTQSKFVMNVANTLEMNITFVSPVYPNDMKRHSLVFSYMNVDVKATDGKSHDVQLYTDISSGAFFCRHF